MNTKKLGSLLFLKINEFNPMSEHTALATASKEQLVVWRLA